jgi:6-phospho-3-hexuloisomerase
MRSRATHERAQRPAAATAQASRWVGIVTEEIESALNVVSPSEIVALVDAVLGARRIYVAGQGGSGLIGRGFAQRLMHIGCESYAVGDIIAPAIGAGDLFVAITASGATETTVRQAQKAQATGATVLAVVQAGGGQLAARSNMVLNHRALERAGSDGNRLG